MVRSRGGSDKPKGRAESSCGRGKRKTKIPLAVQKSIGKMRAAIKAADRAADHSDTSEYVPSQETSEGDSVPTHVPDFLEKFRLVDVPTSSTESSNDSEEGSEASGSSSPPAATPASPAAPAPTDIDATEVPDNGRGGDTIVGGLERSRKSEVWQLRFVSEKAYHKFREWWP
ncbi:PREDICTED: uncharacterized protein LOC109218663 [Nicotiana attenuata]|uniref:uncharacterized protein LOC109218663 n=1 Tax=Nicotiana attenuata TaxID=49451 RepID=UPI0009058373|nr:PREDICTED: uncharacterized protein LOC109218663 [Nicotiana attenuata]